MFFSQKTKASAVSMVEAERALKNDPSIRLIDVRTRAEYRQGHIPGSENLPLDQIADLRDQIPDRQTKIFVYCLSGGRSQSACVQLTQMGYTNVSNIGGITQWPGEIENTLGA